MEKKDKEKQRKAEDILGDIDVQSELIKAALNPEIPNAQVSILPVFRKCDDGAKPIVGVLHIEQDAIGAVSSKSPKKEIN